MQVDAAIYFVQYSDREESGKYTELNKTCTLILDVMVPHY